MLARLLFPKLRKRTGRLGGRGAPGSARAAILNFFAAAPLPELAPLLQVRCRQDPRRKDRSKSSKPDLRSGRAGSEQWTALCDTLAQVAAAEDADSSSADQQVQRRNHHVIFV